MLKVNVLGTEYTIRESLPSENPKLAAAGDGYCDTSIKECVVDVMNDDAVTCKGDMNTYKKSVIRHELIHAFLFKSGLDACAEWARNEEMVDWLAIQFPKLMKAFQEADCL